MPDSDFALSDLKAKLDACIIQLEVRAGLNHAHPELVAVREAADELFRTSLLRKFNVLAHPQRGLRQLIEEGDLRR